MFKVRSGTPGLVCCSHQHLRHAPRQTARDYCCVGIHRQLRQPEDTRSVPAWCKAFIAVGSALAVTLSPANASEDLTITFRASRDPQIRLVQKSLVEAWGKKFNVQGYNRALTHRVSSFLSESCAAAQVMSKPNSWSQTSIIRNGAISCRSFDNLQISVLLPMVPLMSRQTAGQYLISQSSGLELFHCLAGVYQ